MQLHNVTYFHPNKDLLFENISLTIAPHEKAALIGNNGAGKSTLMRILAGELQPAAGNVISDSKPFYVPQQLGQFNHLTVAQALHLEDKLKALHAILQGDVSETNMALLNDDWTLEERCQEALEAWGLEGLDLHQPMQQLSGGQKTKVFLAGIGIHQPDIVLLDEPSNHLDSDARALLYDFIEHTNSTLLVVSHDRQLLNLLDTMLELSKRNITVYGGNYDFYAAQKQLEHNALDQDVKSKEKALRKAKEVERDAAERQSKLNARGKKKQEKAGLPTISMNTFRNNAEKTTARMKDAHSNKASHLHEELTELRKALPDMDKMKFGFENPALHKGKVLLTAKDIRFSYGNGELWPAGLSLQLLSGERLSLKGRNGGGKTTLINIILGRLQPTAGTVQSAISNAVYIDQDYSLINNQLSVYAQAAQFNTAALQDHEIKTRLARFLFTHDYWDKPCNTLSGGEKMRLMLCCLTLAQQAPDVIILDEPTNNLDMQNIAILTAAINAYNGTLIVVSHDRYFLEEVRVQRSIDLGGGLLAQYTDGGNAE